MKYTFASLGRMESLGIRLGGAGLGNILFPWATSLVYAKNHDLKIIKTTWNNLKFGTYIRNEKDKRMYKDLFLETEGISGFEKFFLLNFSKNVRIFSGMDNLFEPFKTNQNFVKSELLKIINPYHIKRASEFNSESIAIHIRMGDFINPVNEKSLRKGEWNYRLPMKWYKGLINKIKKESDLPIYIFSDAFDDEIKEILLFDNCSRVYFGSAISDLIAISKCRILISSASTFSMWASFLGQMPTIWFPGQMRQKLLLDNLKFEGEVDYDDNLPISIIKKLRDV